MSTPRLSGRLSFVIVCSCFGLLHAGPSALFDLEEDANTSVVGVSANGRVLFGQTHVPEALPQQIERPWRGDGSTTHGCWTCFPRTISNGRKHTPSRATVR